MLNLVLTCPEDTATLGRHLAACLARAPFSILLLGPLGSGKTSLSRALVRALPGGELAEVSSPSFTVCNVYPTTPPVLHCDLYRCGEGARLPEEACEAMEEHGHVLLCEWAEFLHPQDVPVDFLQIFFDFLPDSDKNGRALKLAAHGPAASAALAETGRLSLPSA